MYVCQDLSNALRGQVFRGGRVDACYFFAAGESRECLRVIIDFWKLLLSSFGCNV